MGMTVWKNGKPPQMTWTTRTMIQSFGANATGMKKLHNIHIYRIIPEFQFPFSLTDDDDPLIIMTTDERRRKNSTTMIQMRSILYLSHCVCLCVSISVYFDIYLSSVCFDCGLCVSSLEHHYKYANKLTKMVFL